MREARAVGIDRTGFVPPNDPNLLRLQSIFPIPIRPFRDNDFLFNQLTQNRPSTRNAYIKGFGDLRSLRGRMIGQVLDHCILLTLGNPFIACFYRLFFIACFFKNKR